MQNKLTKGLFALLVLLSFTSCELVGDIFQAGMGVGVFIVIAIVILVVFVISKIRGRN